MKLEWDFNELYEFANKLQNSYNFQTSLMTATKEIAQVLHKYLLVQTPVVTGNLRKMWSAGDNLAFTVEKISNGYEVTLINTARTDEGFMYGLAVNDGHKTPSGEGWVMGRFFVERSILQTSNSAEIENIVMRQLQKWWDSI
jgi:hypothetical protein